MRLSPRSRSTRARRSAKPALVPARSARLRPSVQSHFRVETRNEARGTVLTVMGELDLASAPALEDELEKAMNCGTECVVVDLRALEFIDSTGLSVLVRAHQRAEERGC